MSESKEFTGCMMPLGYGSMLAAVLSASLNHSFWWGVLHFLCGWTYVLYALILRSTEVIPALRHMFGV